MMISMRNFLLTLLLLLPLTLQAKSDDLAGTVQIQKGRATATSADGDIRISTGGGHRSQFDTTADSSVPFRARGDRDLGALAIFLARFGRFDL